MLTEAKGTIESERKRRKQRISVLVFQARKQTNKQMNNQYNLNIQIVNCIGYNIKSYHKCDLKAGDNKPINVCV